MKTWTKILPFFIVEWYARKNCEKLYLDSVTPLFDMSGNAIYEIWVTPYRGTLVAVDKED